jgi:hypothetical protein
VAVRVISEVKWIGVKWSGVEWSGVEWSGVNSEFVIQEESTPTCEDLKCDWKILFLSNI